VRRAKYVLIAVVAIALAIVALQTYSTNSNMIVRLAPVLAPGNGDINYPNPLNPNVTVTGLMTSVVVAPTCSLSSPPCAVADSPLYYVRVNGWNYRLIFPSSMKLPANRAHILVTGVFITPSTYQASLWMPEMSFRGDIYVLSYSYVSPYY
jgi:hypothetical protein